MGLLGSSQYFFDFVFYFVKEGDALVFPLVLVDRFAEGVDVLVVIVFFEVCVEVFEGFLHGECEFAEGFYVHYHAVIAVVNVDGIDDFFFL